MHRPCRECECMVWVETIPKMGMALRSLFHLAGTDSGFGVHAHLRSLNPLHNSIVN